MTLPPTRNNIETTVQFQSFSFYWPATPGALRVWNAVMWCPRPLSLPRAPVRHQRPGVCPGLHGAGVEAARLCGRFRHHRLLCGLSRGHQRCGGPVARGQHPVGQRQSLQGECLSQPIRSENMPLQSKGPPRLEQLELVELSIQGF